MPKQYRLSIRGSQNEEIDEDLLAQALLMVAEDLEREQQSADGDQSASTGQDDQ